MKIGDTYKNNMETPISNSTAFRLNKTGGLFPLQWGNQFKWGKYKGLKQKLASVNVLRNEIGSYWLFINSNVSKEIISLLILMLHNEN